jgi:hypothetical protein
MSDRLPKQSPTWQVRLPEERAAIGDSGSMDASLPEAVDVALSRLAELEAVSLPEQAAVYELIYTDLRGALESSAAREVG